MSVAAMYSMSASADSKLSQALTMKQYFEELLTNLRGQTQSPHPPLKAFSQFIYLPYYYTYKAHIELAFEYHIVRGSAGTGHEFKFDVPLYGDLFADMVLNVQIPSVQATPYSYLNKLPATPEESDRIGGFSRKVALNYITLPDGSKLPTVEKKQIFNKDVVYLRQVQYVYQTVDGRVYTRDQLVGQQDGGYTERLPKFQDFVYYCDYPGERVLEKVEFQINSNPITSYTYHNYVHYRNFFLPAEKKLAYERAMGQEQPSKGFSLNVSNDTREMRCFLNGYQTPKLKQKTLNMWIPLMFWFNEKFHNAIPSAAVPQGSRYIHAIATDPAKLLHTRGSLYRIARVYNFRVADDAKYVIKQDGSLEFTNGSEDQVAIPESLQEYPMPLSSSQGESGAIKDVKYMKFDLYVNHIFTASEIHKIITNRMGVYLMRLKMTQTSIIDRSSGEIQLTELKYPIEYFTFSATPLANQGKNGQPTMSICPAQDWHKSCWVKRKCVSPLCAPVQKDSREASDVSRYVCQVKEKPVLQDIQVKIAQISFFHKTSIDFYNNYMTWKWPGVSAPVDQGTGLVSFKLDDLQDDQPAGSLNASRIREFYISYNAPKVNTSNLAELCIIGNAINFLLVSDGTMAPRYVA